MRCSHNAALPRASAGCRAPREARGSPGVCRRAPGLRQRVAVLPGEFASCCDAWSLLFPFHVPARPLSPARKGAVWSAGSGRVPAPPRSSPRPRLALERIPLARPRGARFPAPARASSPLLARRTRARAGTCAPDPRGCGEAFSSAFNARVLEHASLPPPQRRIGLPNAAWATKGGRRVRDPGPPRAPRRVSAVSRDKMKAAIASVGVSRRGEPPSGPLTSRALPRAPGHAGAPRGRSARSQRLVTRRTGRSASGSRSRFRQSAPRPPTVAGRPQGHADHLQDRPRPGRGHLRGRRGLLLHDHE